MSPEGDFRESTSCFGRVGKGTGETISVNVGLKKKRKEKKISTLPCKINYYLIKISLEEATKKNYILALCILSRKVIKAM